MLKPLSGKTKKRVIFREKKQQQFLLEAVEKSKLPWNVLAEKLGIHKRTLNDWKREKYSMSLSALQKICKIANLKRPTDIEIRDAFWYTKIGGEIAGRLVYKKYGVIGGNPELRKQKWVSWWNKIGKFKLSPCFIQKEIQKPNKSIGLTEFVGIIMGDGGITKRQVTITLNYKTDKEYSVFVKNLVKKLFKIKPALYIRKSDSTINIIISRTQLVLFCSSIGLKIGNKLAQNLDVPKWIKRNKNFKIACLRGLMDTDGCVFNECHNINKRKYCYPRLSLVSFSEALRFSVFKILKELGFSPKIHNDRSVQLENKQEIIKYFNLVGTHNQKHYKRFRAIIGRVG